LNQPVGDDKGTTAMDLLEDESLDQEQLLIERQTDQALTESTEKALKKLDPRERFIVTKRFMDDAPWTLQELGDHFGTSRERVRQIEKRALNKLRSEFSPQLLESAMPA
jgi:RNA polymerase sigma-32 factor